MGARADRGGLERSVLHTSAMQVCFIVNVNLDLKYVHALSVVSINEVALQMQNT